MRVKTVLNNSAIIVQEGTEETIHIGKGIGFNKKIGDCIDGTKTEKVFQIRDEKYQLYIDLINEVPEEFFHASNTIIRYIETKLQKNLDYGIHISLLDHINSALTRYEDGINLKFGMCEEIKLLYPLEYDIAKWAVEFLNASFGINLSFDECGFITLHIINATSQEDIGTTNQILEIVELVSNIVEEKYISKQDVIELNYSRFITHLKYFALRYLNHDQISEDEDIEISINPKYVSMTKKCLNEINKQLELHYSQRLTDYEEMYILMHLCRLKR